ncbi:MAG: DUF2461 domain-containing protein [Verrucomicrobia bacterium]|nr:MAG: DUF2461 domain-containing protein [Verrucomicrobiota bacterium]
MISRVQHTVKKQKAPVLTSATLAFLTDLKTNNNRAWFAANRKRYEAARAEFIQLVDAFIAGIAHHDPRLLELDPADCVFRINHDTRFAHHKEPYKTHFGAFITDRGRKVTRAGYYFHLEPGACLVAGGLYMPPAVELHAIRRAILADAPALRQLLGKKSFVAAFGKKLPGAHLKIAPRDVPKDHPDLDLLRLKSYEVYRDLPDRRVLSRNLVKITADYFATMHPYVAWLNRALDRAGRDR